MAMLAELIVAPLTFRSTASATVRALPGTISDPDPDPPLPVTPLTAFSFCQNGIARARIVIVYMLSRFQASPSPGITTSSTYSRRSGL